MDGSERPRAHPHPVRRSLTGWGSAVVPLVQRKLMAAQRTALLQTGPGHVTRCLDSDFVGEFGRRSAGLTAAVRSGPALWEQLELLNAGRLRVAAKGQERDGAALDEAAQSAAGLYMAGQVAVLRSAQTTVATTTVLCTAPAGPSGPGANAG